MNPDPESQPPESAPRRQPPPPSPIQRLAQIAAELVAQWALDDLEDIDEADVFILFTEEPGAEAGRRGGRNVELGYALAIDRDVAIVGPPENTFHALSIVEQFENFEDCLEWIGELCNEDES